MRTMNQPPACYFRCARRTLHWFIELIRASLNNSWRRHIYMEAKMQPYPKSHHTDLAM